MRTIFRWVVLQTLFLRWHSTNLQKLINRSLFLCMFFFTCAAAYTFDITMTRRRSFRMIARIFANNSWTVTSFLATIPSLSPLQISQTHCQWTSRWRSSHNVRTDDNGSLFWSIVEAPLKASQTAPFSQTIVNSTPSGSSPPLQVDHFEVVIPDTLAIGTTLNITITNISYVERKLFWALL